MFFRHLSIVTICEAIQGHFATADVIPFFEKKNAFQKRIGRSLTNSFLAHIRRLFLGEVELW